MSTVSRVLLSLVVIASGGTALAIYNGTPENNPEYAGVGQILPTATHGPGVATFVSKHAILTAAQCVTDTTPGASFDFALSTGLEASATVVVMHPEYLITPSPNPVYDVALLVLDKTQTKTWPSTAPATIGVLPVPDRSLATGIGFGDTSDVAGAGSKQSGHLLVTNYVGGQGTFGQFIPGAFLRVAPGDALGQMFCAGDFGGPLFVDGELAGVASFTDNFNCGDPGPGYCVAVDRLADWIQSTLDEVDPPGACSCNDTAAFATNGGGCADMASGLVWSSSASGLNHAAAMAYADSLVEAGRDDWRLPTVSDAQKLDENHGVPRAVEAPEVIWTSSTTGNQAWQYSFRTHQAKLAPPGRKAGCITVRSAP